MTLARLFIPLLLVCSLPALAQDRPTTNVRSHDKDVSIAKNSADVAPSAEAWKLSGTLAYLNSSSDDGLRIFREDHGHVQIEKAPRGLVLNAAPGFAPLDGELGADITCFTIRSYVVARDSKDSDAVHPKGYSTCQKASRYRVKTAAGDPVSLER